MDAKIAEALAAIKAAETSAEKRRAKERKEDLMRLKRVEQIYVRFLYIPIWNIQQPDSLIDVECYITSSVRMGTCSAETVVGDSFSQFAGYAGSPVLDIFCISSGCCFA